MPITYNFPFSKKDKLKPLTFIRFLNLSDEIIWEIKYKIGLSANNNKFEFSIIIFNDLILIFENVK